MLSNSNMQHFTAYLSPVIIQFTTMIHAHSHNENYDKI